MKNRNMVALFVITLSLVFLSFVVMKYEVKHYGGVTVEYRTDERRCVVNPVKMMQICLPVEYFAK